MATNYGSMTYAQRGEAAQLWSLSAGTLTIGSKPDNDLVLDSSDVAGYHASIHCTNAGCWVTDLASASGTWLNLAQLEPNTRQRLDDGDILRIGPFFLRYAQLEKSAQVGAASVASQLPAAAMQAAVPVRRLQGSSGPARLAAGRRRMALQASSYLQYLPPCYQDNTFLGRFLLLFESVLGPIEMMIDQIHFYFDPQMTPEAVLPWLASWVDLVMNEHWPIEQRRALVSAAAALYRYRGTRYGLSEYLRIYSGTAPLIIEPGREQRYGERELLPPHVFKVILEVDNPDLLDRAMIEQIIEQEKPAHTSYILELRRQP